MVSRRVDERDPCGENLLDWIGLVYEGPLEEVPWTSFLATCLDVFRAEAATLILRRPVEGDSGLILGAGGKGPRWESGYAEKFFAIDPFLQLPLGRVVTLDEITSFEAYEESDFFRQFMEPTGNYFLMGFDAEFGVGTVVRFRVSRALEEGNFDTADRDRCAQLVPHVSRALRLFERLEHTASQRRLYADAIDQMAVAFILIDDQCRILESSSAAESFLAESDVFEVSDGRLEAVDPEENLAIRRAVADTLAARRGGGPSMAKALGVGSKSGKTQIGIALRPAESRRWLDEETRDLVEVFIRTPVSRGPARPEAIARLFGLTAAEANLTARLVDGERLAEAATALGITRNTARNQLSSVFAKTGVGRQADLVRLVFEMSEAFSRVDLDA